MTEAHPIVLVAMGGHAFMLPGEKGTIGWGSLTALPYRTRNVSRIRSLGKASAVMCSWR